MSKVTKMIVTSTLVTRSKKLDVRLYELGYAKGKLLSSANYQAALDSRELARYVKLMVKHIRARLDSSFSCGFANALADRPKLLEAQLEHYHSS